MVPLVAWDLRHLGGGDDWPPPFNGRRLTVRTFNLSVLGALALLAGCATAPAQTADPQLPAANAQGQYTISTWPERMPAMTRYVHIRIGPDVLEECNLPRAHFAFDSSEVRPQDTDELAALANCLNDERFTDQTVTLVGRTDTRGQDSYNEELGLARAERVKAFLVDKGVDASRIVVQSVGENGAQEGEAFSQGWDRRVDVLVMGGVHRP